jgi:hypothetical protein
MNIKFSKITCKESSVIILLNYKNFEPFKKIKNNLSKGHSTKNKTKGKKRIRFPDDLNGLHGLYFNINPVKQFSSHF